MVEIVDDARPRDVVRGREVEPRGRLGDDVAVDGIRRALHEEIAIPQRQASGHPRSEAGIGLGVDRPERVDIEEDSPVLGAAHHDAGHVLLRGRPDPGGRLGRLRNPAGEVEGQRAIGPPVVGGLPVRPRHDGGQQDPGARLPQRLLGGVHERVDRALGRIGRGDRIRHDQTGVALIARIDRRDGQHHGVDDPGHPPALLGDEPELPERLPVGGQGEEKRRLDLRPGIVRHRPERRVPRVTLPCVLDEQGHHPGDIVGGCGADGSGHVGLRSGRALRSDCAGRDYRRPPGMSRGRHAPKPSGTPAPQTAPSGRSIGPDHQRSKLGRRAVRRGGPPPPCRPATDRVA